MLEDVTVSSKNLALWDPVRAVGVDLRLREGAN